MWTLVLIWAMNKFYYVLFFIIFDYVNVSHCCRNTNINRKCLLLTCLWFLKSNYNNTVIPIGSLKCWTLVHAQPVWVACCYIEVNQYHNLCHLFSYHRIIEKIKLEAGAGDHLLLVNVWSNRHQVWANSWARVL